MKRWLGVLMTLYVLSITVLAAVTLPYAAGWLSIESTFPYLLSAPAWRETVTGVLVLYLLGGIFILGAAAGPGRGRSVVVEAPLGEVRIALTAIEELVEKIAISHSGVRAVKARVTGVAQGLKMEVNVSVADDSQVPELARLLQEEIRSRVREVTGTEVEEVRLLVRSITARRPRVE